MWELQIANIDFIQVAEVMITLAATYVIARIVSRTLAKVFEKTPFPEAIERWLVRVSKYVVYAIGLLATIAISGFDLTSVIVGLGAFSIAISFAMSTVIQNFVSGILVQADRAFSIGDEIRVQSFEGTVQKISVRTTVVETKEGDTVFIPNSLFLSNPVIRKKKNGGESRSQ